MTEPSVPVGFDYSKAMLHIRSRMTYEEIAEYLGYDSVGAIGKIIGGAIPSHPIGEALFALYRELFGRKPPMSKGQSVGTYDLHSSANLSPSTTV